MKKDTGIRVKYGVPYFIVRVMAIGMLFLILNTRDRKSTRLNSSH